MLDAVGEGRNGIRLDGMLDDVAEVVGHYDLVEGFRINATILNSPAGGNGADIGGIEVGFGIAPLGDAGDLFEFIYYFLGWGIDPDAVFRVKIMDGKIAVGNYFCWDIRS